MDRSWENVRTLEEEIDPWKNNRINMKLPLFMIKIYKKMKGRALEDVIPLSDRELRGAKVRFESGLIKSLFHYLIEKTVNHVRTLMKERNVRDIKAILMVFPNPRCFKTP